MDNKAKSMIAVNEGFDDNQAMMHQQVIIYMKLACSTMLKNRSGGFFK